MDEPETTDTGSFAEDLLVIVQRKEKPVRTNLDSCKPLWTDKLAKPADFLGKNHCLHL
jgi:hypothetical protein